MSFKKWLEGYDKEYRDYMLDGAKKQMFNGMIELKDKDTTAYVWSGWDEKSLHLFTAYKNERTTKMLVWATWALAIGTLVLSGLTIYFQYFKS